MMELTACGNSEAHETENATEESVEVIETEEIDFTEADQWLNSATMAVTEYCDCMTKNNHLADSCFNQFDNAAEFVENLNQSALALGEENNATYLQEVDKLSDQIDACQTSDAPRVE